MNIETEKRGEVTILRPVGRVDSATSGAFEQAIVAAFDGGIRLMVLDFSRLEYISSAGLRSTLIAGKKARALPEGQLVLCSLSPQVAEIFAISGFNTIFTICNNLDEALCRFS